MICGMKDFETYDGYDAGRSDVPACDICGRVSRSCAEYNLRGRGTIRICPHCLIASDSEDVRFAMTFGKLVRK